MSSLSGSPWKFPGSGRSHQHTEVFRTILRAAIVWDESATIEPNVRFPFGLRFGQVCEPPPKASRGSAVHPIGIETDDSMHCIIDKKILTC